MLKKVLIFVVIASVFTTKCKAQKNQKTEKKKQETMQIKYVYINVIKTYERMAEKGVTSIDLLKQIADSYYNKSEYSIAAKWHAELFAITADLDPKYIYQYKISMQQIGKNTEANKVLDNINLKRIAEE